MLSKRFVPVLGLTLLIAALLPFRLWRAGLETSLWVDETASLVLSSQPIGMIFDTSAIDTNPPGYYLLLKVWLKIGRALGFEPGILWARLLGVLAWVGLAIAAWIAGRKLLGSPYGGVLAVAVAGSSYSAVLANDARGYSIASVALFVCFLTLLLSYQEEIAGDGQISNPWWPSVARWLLYTAGATAALWTHLLSLPILGCLALIWLVLIARADAWTSRFARLGAAAQLATVLLFLPWLFQLKRQVSGLQASAPTWMTPPTGFNLSAVFWWWYPFGRFGDPGRPPTLLLPVVGALSVLLPLVMAIGFTLRIPRTDRQTRCLGLLASCGLGVSVAFVGLLWMIQRLGLASVFYAPRYPALSAALWASGLVGLAGLAGARNRSQGMSLWGLLMPWIACSIIGQWCALPIESQGGLADALARQHQKPPPGAPLYVMPSELMPFYRRTLSEYHVQRIEDLPCGLAGVSESWVLNLSPWRVFDRPRDLIVQKLLASDLLAGAVQRVSIARDYDLYHLSSIQRNAAAALCRQGIQPAGRRIPQQAVSVALPEEQRYADGWSYPEVSSELRMYRWATAPAVAVRFEPSLPAGDYIVHYEGYRSAQPQNPANMSFDFGATSQAISQPAGEVSLQLRVHLEQRMRHPQLLVHHPLWSPAASGSGDARHLASALSFAWIEHL